MGIPVIGLGAGGHARVVIDTLRSLGRYDLVGMLDSNAEMTGKELLGVPVLGTDDLLPKLVKDVHHFFIGVGSTGPVTRRLQLYEMATGLGMEPINIIHPLAILSETARHGSGVTIFARAIINACSVLGIDVVVNTGAIIEHDCVLGDHIHIATGACLCGGVHVESEAHIGAGSILLQGVTVGRGSIIGAGTVVIRDVPPRVTVVGVPAKIIKSLRRHDDEEK